MGTINLSFQSLYLVKWVKLVKYVFCDNCGGSVPFKHSRGGRIEERRLIREAAKEIY